MVLTESCHVIVELYIIRYTVVMSKGYIRGANRQSLLSNEFSAGQIQNVKASKVYVFGNEHVAEDEEEYELEMSEIRSRRGGSQTNRSDVTHSEDTFFEKELGEGDTLQKLSLQYACPVSELKRINNLIRDQEFYALRYIKVPIKKYGFVSEFIEQEKKQRTLSKYSSSINGTSGGNASDALEDPESSHDFSDPETQMKIIHELSIRDNMTSQSREAENFLRSMDKDLKRMVKSRSDRNSLDEVISVLTNKTFHPLERKPVQIFNGTDCGMTYWKIVALVIIICLVCPAILAYLYFYGPWKSKGIDGGE